MPQGLAKRGVSVVEARDEGTAEVIVEVEEGVEKKRIGGETF